MRSGNKQSGRRIGGLRRLIRVLLCTVGIGVIALSGAAGMAASGVEKVPYESYTYWQGFGQKKMVKDYPMYEPKGRIDGSTLGVSGLNNPAGLSYNGRDRVYLLDGENSRILVMDTDYRLVKVIDRLSQDGKALSFTGARGISVNRDGVMLVADTENERVLLCDEDGTVRQVLTLPDSDLIPAEFQFSPIKAVRDKKGFTYVLNNGTYYGAMIYEKGGAFLGFYGANKVTVNPLTVIGNLFESLFNTVEKRAVSEQKLPYQFADLCVDTEDFVYTATADDESGTGQIRRLNPHGSNILYYKDGYESENANDFNFGDMLLDEVQNFKAIDVDENGYIYALQSTYGKIFVYDSECRCLTVFGNSVGAGLQTGSFQSASALCVVGDDVLVLDSVKNNVTVFGSTEYGRLVKKADALTLSANYEEALPYWQQVLRYNSSSQLANSGAARAYYAREDYETAARYARLGMDRSTYAQAFREVRTTWLSHNFYWVFGLVLLAVGGLTALLIYTGRRQVVLIRPEKLRVALSVIAHPFDSFQQVKYKKKGSVWIGAAILVLFYVFSVLDAIYGGFMYTTFDAQTFNCLYTLMGGVGVALLWMVVNWGVCVLFEGKGRIGEIFVITTYSLIPLLVQRVLHLALSQFLIPTDSSLIPILTVVCTIAFGLLLLIGTMTVQDYGFFKTLGTSLLTVVGMALVVFILFMTFTLFQDFIGFIRSVAIEVMYR